jgi:hypothetical protein
VIDDIVSCGVIANIRYLLFNISSTLETLSTQFKELTPQKPPPLKKSKAKEPKQTHFELKENSIEFFETVEKMLAVLEQVLTTFHSILKHFLSKLLYFKL